MAWTRANTSPEQRHQDYAECEITAYGKYPDNVAHIASDNLREPSKDVDTNETLRNEETSYCMRQRATCSSVPTERTVACHGPAVGYLPAWYASLMSAPQPRHR